MKYSEETYKLHLVNCQRFSAVLVSLEDIEDHGAPNQTFYTEMFLFQNSFYKNHSDQNSKKFWVVSKNQETQVLRKDKRKLPQGYSGSGQMKTVTWR